MEQILFIIFLLVIIIVILLVNNSSENQMAKQQWLSAHGEYLYTIHRNAKIFISPFHQATEGFWVDSPNWVKNRSSRVYCSNDEAFIAQFFDDYGTILVFSLHTGALIAQLKPQDLALKEFMAIEWSASNLLIVGKTKGKKQICLWNPSTLQLEQTWEIEAVFSDVKISPNAEWLGFDAEDEPYDVRLWNPQLDVKQNAGHGFLGGWSPNGQFLLILTGNDSGWQARVWDVQRQETISQLMLEEDSAFDEVMWHPNNQHILLWGDPIAIWNFQTNAHQILLKNSDGAIYQVVWSTDCSEIRYIEKNEFKTLPTPEFKV